MGVKPAHPGGAGKAPRAGLKSRSAARIAPLIDVIIPAYRGLAQTRRCLESVLAAPVRAPHEVVVVDDASPEPALSAWLRDLAAAGRITLLAHADNRGFVASVNEGMRLHPDRDVVLLNSDTEVAGDWLDRLAACAAREPRAGTVTPFSSNATIASYPRFCQANALPPGETVATLDAAFARANAGRSADLPTAVGFCMFICRACLDATGPFDEAAFGRGYGEEVDFCLRAAKDGWRHLLAADVLVFHEGEVSFGPGAAGIRETAQRVIDARHPEFQPRLADFLAREPVRPLRRAADLERLRAGALPRILFVTHGWGGGIDKHVRDLAGLLAGAATVLLLRPAGEGVASLSWLAAGEEFEAFFAGEGDWELLVELLASLGLASAHFHHVHGLPPAALDLPSRLGLAYDVTLHDYLAVCPQHHLADADGRYCGEPGEAGCAACLARRPPAWPLAIGEWRARFGRFLAGARRVIAPSQDLAARHRRHFPALAMVQWSHPEPEGPGPRAPVRVLLPGGLSAIKGLAVVEACARDAKARALPLHFRVLGHLERPIPQWPEAPVTITGSFPDGTLDELVAQERGDVVFFPAQVPESYSYTLSAAMRSGLPIVATDLGALPERLRDYPSATLVAADAPAAVLNDALLAAAR
jgi:GT2 family glycosyltransferase/glycosyltransferase involved in cell wall biosynthesis